MPGRERDSSNCLRGKEGGKNSLKSFAQPNPFLFLLSDPQTELEAATLQARDRCFSELQKCRAHSDFGWKEICP
ncbi:hypothetical protein CEXT_374141 [Caerostris extrusa]|uniref:Uncharacterized protein n=1 Tax=Caerostris extrusa TaxID=172846 RepID=A0AAV4TCS2_CAEEX|nr:hypothetical protein CEXT_374141 [Caerostris extrusa]